MKLYRMICLKCKEGTRFYSKVRPEAGQAIIAEKALNQDFSQAVAGQRMPECDSCGFDGMQQSEDFEIMNLSLPEDA